MASALREDQSAATSQPVVKDSLAIHSDGPVGKDELDQVLRALAIPFDVAVVQWRVTEWSDDGARGLMLPYADPRAYSDRLN
jgi:hypothetical protein